MLELKLEAPNYFFIPLDNELLKVYNEGFSLGDIFKVRGSGILTAADELLINTKLNKLKENIKLHLESEDTPFKGYCLDKKEKDLNGAYKTIPYRVFDNRYYYDSKLTSSICLNLTKHESIEDNYYLSFCSSAPDNDSFSHLLVTKSVPECKLVKGKRAIHSAPLYIINEQNKGQI